MSITIILVSLDCIMYSIPKCVPTVRDDASMTSARWGGGGVKNVSKNVDIYNIASAFLGGGGVNNGQKWLTSYLNST